ncbi:sulfatase-like hydrolase/transferase [Verrucomicrobiaceae bacterium N1E253]|uniref:Sulfatase-like hydrolase/transferase n=1 Tax=Oceaniferula marina TaxID=2748318 RepID=A0A851GEP0_9BACT|nr:sulfatase-like hydrolase/transferase [Oceaniferula marina]NWK54191.1 sulfatase-like hydrolase/transferase [Oceaniferula marina]
MNLILPIHHANLRRSALCVVSLLFSGLCSVWGDEKAPNIVIILADDMGYADVGFNGCKDIPTPHLDALADSGVRFVQGYVSASVCGPSRAGLLTGRYQQRFGCGENAPEEGWPDHPRCRDAGVPRSEQLLSELLKPAGYRTGVIGKWHLGLDEPLRPNSRGFDYFYGFLNGSHSFTHAHKKWGKHPELWPIYRNREPLDYRGYLTDTFTDESVHFIERNKERPFFLYVTYNAVHSPWQAPANVADKVRHIADKNRRVYAGMLVSLDDGVGRIIKSLKDQGVYQNTVVVFLSDNGAPKSSSASSAPLRGFKGDTYEGGTRVPFVMSWPAKIQAGTVYAHPVSSLDLVPTMVQLAGAKPAKKRLDGVDLMPFILGEKRDRPHEVMFFRRDDDYAIRQQDWKLLWNNGAPSGTRKVELFNLADDPNETTDLISQYPEKAKKLQKQFDAWDGKLPDNAWWGGPKNRKR